MNHLNENIEIIGHIIDEVMEHPELRFIQILWALDIVDSTDRFHELPTITLNKIKSRKSRKEN